MGRKEKSDAYFLEKTEHYGDYDVTLEVIPNTIGGDLKFHIENAIYTVNITVIKEDRRYHFDNYYINVDSGLEHIGNQIARRIVENINDITFKYGKLIGTIKETSEGTVIKNDPNIVEELKRRNQKTYSNNLFNIYMRYQSLKNGADKRDLLKHAAFLEMQFTSHQIPDNVRGAYFNNLKENDPLLLKPIFDYAELDERIKKEFEGNWSKFGNKELEMRESYQLLSRLDNRLNTLAERMRILKSILQKFKEFIDGKNAYDIALKEEEKIKIEKANTSPFNFSRMSKIRNALAMVSDRVKKNKKYGDKSEEVILRTNVVREIEKGIISKDIISIEDAKALNIIEIEKIINECYISYQNEHDKDREDYDRILNSYNPNGSLVTLKADLRDMTLEDLNIELISEDSKHEESKGKGY